MGVRKSDYQLLSMCIAQMLIKVIEMASKAVDRIQFSFLFLSIGRQREPHHCIHLFPFLKSVGLEGSSTEDALLSLYLEAVTTGSLSIAFSALFLLSHKRLTHQRCINLLHHCITKICRGCHSKNRRSISFFFRKNVC